MRTLRSAVGTVIVTAVLLAGSSPAGAVVEPTVRTDWQERMLTQVNTIRAAAGSRPVRLCAALGRSAETYAREMSRVNRFSHTGADGSTAGQRIASAGYRAALVGENLAAGQPTVAAATGDWRRSPSHYATMTDPRFRHVGFGYERGRSPKYATFWVQHFGDGGPCR